MQGRSFWPWASFRLSYRVFQTCAFAKASPKSKNPRRPTPHLSCQCSNPLPTLRLWGEETRGVGLFPVLEIGDHTEDSKWPKDHLEPTASYPLSANEIGGEGRGEVALSFIQPAIRLIKEMKVW